MYASFEVIVKSKMVTLQCNAPTHHALYLEVLRPKTPYMWILGNCSFVLYRDNIRILDF